MIVAEKLHACQARYHELVAGNRSPEWDTFAAVGWDRDGDVVFELAEVADDLGVELTDEDRDALGDWLADHYRPLLRAVVLSELGVPLDVDRLPDVLAPYVLDLAEVAG